MRTLTNTSTKTKVLILAVIGLLTMANFGNIYNALAAEIQNRKIVSVSGTTSEILCALGLQSEIVGTDVTSTYPAALQSLPKVGHNRNITAEGILSLGPNVVVGVSNDLRPDLQSQLTSSGVSTKFYKLVYSVDGTKAMIREMAAYFKLTAKGEELIKTLDKDLATVKKPTVKKKVLFIYARGAGNMMVAGNGTSVEKMIELAGGQNAVTGFNDYKPLTAEALIAANPDVILLFDSGMESIGGPEGLLNVPGVAQTTAGKQKKFIQMDGQLLTGFGPRLGKGVAELASKLQ